MVTLDGEVLAAPGAMGRVDAIRRRHFGIMFQTLRLVSVLTVRANLALAQKLRHSKIENLVRYLGVDVEDALVVADPVSRSP